MAIRGGPRYLAMYELDDVSVLRTAAFLDELRFRPSPQRQRASGGHVGRNFMLHGYRQIFPARTDPIELTMGPSPYLQMGRIDVPAAIEEEFNDWYNWVYIPTYLTVPGVIRARRYLAVDAQPKYLTVYEFERGDVPDSRGVATGPGVEPVEPPHPSPDAPRRRLAGGVSADQARSGTVTPGGHAAPMSTRPAGSQYYSGPIEASTRLSRRRRPSSGARIPAPVASRRIVHGVAPESSTPPDS